MADELTDAEVFRDPMDILPMGGRYDWRCYVPRHGPYFLCKDGLPLRDSSRWNPDGWRVCAVEVGQEEAIKRFAEYVASLHAQIPEATLPWQDRAGDLSKAAWDAVKQANGGKVTIDATTPVGLLSHLTLEMARHVGKAGEEIDSLRAELREAVEIFKGLGIGKHYYHAGEVYEATSRAESFLKKMESDHG